LLLPDARLGLFFQVGLFEAAMQIACDSGRVLFFSSLALTSRFDRARSSAKSSSPR
jgi:hypothetical protein